MLADLTAFARSYRQTPPAFRPFVGAAVRDWSRGNRHLRAWAPHMANSRGLIDTAIDDLEHRRTVVVLGSGALLEIPLEALGRTFERVVLVDRAHLAPVRRRCAPYGNVTHQWRDLTPRGADDGLGFLAEIGDLDWVISANLVSTLGRAAPPEAAAPTVARHLDGLAALACPATLLTDLDYRVFNRHGVLLDSADLLHGYPLPRSGLRWKWEAAPFGADAPHTRRVHYVGAWTDWRQR